MVAGKRSLEVEALNINYSCLYQGLQGLRTLTKMKVNSLSVNYMFVTFRKKTILTSMLKRIIKSVASFFSSIVESGHVLVLYVR